MTALHELRSAVDHPADECIRWERSLAGNGYGMVRAYGKMRGAHVVVCTWVHGHKPEGLEVAHSCGVRCCVNPRHLRWATHVDNVADRWKHGTQTHGAAHHAAVLNADTVRAARAEHADGATYTELGARYGVSRVAVRNAIVGRTWAHVS